MFEDQTLASLRSLRTVRALRPLRAVSRLEGMKVSSEAHRVRVRCVDTPFTNCSTFLTGCRERAFFRYTWNRQRAPGISPVLVDIQYPGSTTFRGKVLQVPGLGRRTCCGGHRTKQDSVPGAP